MVSDIYQLKEHATRRLRNVLEASSCMPVLQSVAWRRCAYGLREEEFDELVRELITQKYVVRDMTKRGKFVLRKNVEV